MEVDVCTEIGLRLVVVSSSDFPARLGLKAGSAAQLLEASGLSNSKPEPVFQASKGLGLVTACKPRLPGLIRLMNNELCVT